MKNIQQDILQKSTAWTLLRLATPMIIAFSFQTGFNFVDRYFVSRLGDVSTAAVGMSFIIQLFIIAIGAGVGVGLNSYISRNVGAKRIENATQAALHSFVIAPVLGLLILVCLLPAQAKIFRLLGAEGELLHSISDYLTIILLFSPVYLLGMLTNNIFRGWGNTVHPMKFMLLGTVGNLILDPILIFGWFGFPAMGIKGAALATGISRTLALIYTLFILFGRRIPIKLRFSSLKFSLKTIRGIFQVGLPASLGQMLTSLSLGLIFLILRNFGTEAKTAYTISFTYEMIAFMPVLGIGQAIAIMAGQNYGAKQYDRIRSVYFDGLKMTVSITLVISFLISLAPHFFATIFARSNTSISISTEALRIMAPGYVFSGIFLCTVTIFQGLGLGKHQLNATLMRLFLFILPLALIGSKIWSINGVWSGILFANFLTAILMMLWFRSLYYKKLIKGKINTLK